jgi:hypothetical protein
MHAFQFNKAFAQQVLDALEAGKPIPVPECGWTPNRMLAVAGVLFATVSMEGPQGRELLGPIADHVAASARPDRPEDAAQTLTEELKNAIEFIGMATSEVFGSEGTHHHQPA